MNVSSSHQLAVMLMAMAAGIVCGAIYTFLSAIRSALRGGGGLAMITDLLFWTAFGAGMLWICTSFNDGEVRLYQILAALCGLTLHWLCFAGISRAVSYVLVKAIGIILSPAVFFARGLRLYFKAIMDKISKIGVKAKMHRKKTTNTRRIRKNISKNYKKMT